MAAHSQALGGVLASATGMMSEAPPTIVIAQTAIATPIRALFRITAPFCRNPRRPPPRRARGPAIVRRGRHDAHGSNRSSVWLKPNGRWSFPASSGTGNKVPLVRSVVSGYACKRGPSMQRNCCGAAVIEGR
jgi:hypothetical protein